MTSPLYHLAQTKSTYNSYLIHKIFLHGKNNVCLHEKEIPPEISAIKSLIWKDRYYSHD